MYLQKSSELLNNQKNLFHIIGKFWFTTWFSLCEIPLLYSSKKRNNLQDEITTHGMQLVQNSGSDILEKYLRAYSWKQGHACGLTKKGQEIQ